MKKKYLWMMAAILVCATSVLTSCSDTTDNPVMENDPLAEKRAQLQALYGENKKITDDNYRVCTRLIIMRKVPIRGRNPAKRPPFTFRARTACA